MIKRIKHFMPEALINSTKFRQYAENSESEILRGISTLTILTIIRRHESSGIYGYQLLKELQEETQNMLIIEEGTLYPLLKKIEKEGIIVSEKKNIGGRTRKYYIITHEGIQIQNHLVGFFNKLVESLGPLMDINVDLLQEQYLYCPNCANKIDFSVQDARYCEVCGLNIENIKKKSRFQTESDEKSQNQFLSELKNQNDLNGGKINE